MRSAAQMGDRCGCWIRSASCGECCRAHSHTAADASSSSRMMRVRKEASVSGATEWHRSSSSASPAAGLPLSSVRFILLLLSLTTTPLALRLALSMLPLPPPVLNGSPFVAHIDIIVDMFPTEMARWMRSGIVVCACRCVAADRYRYRWRMNRTIRFDRFVGEGHGSEGLSANSGKRGQVEQRKIDLTDQSAQSQRMVTNTVREASTWMGTVRAQAEGMIGIRVTLVMRAPVRRSQCAGARIASLLSQTQEK